MRNPRQRARRPARPARRQPRRRRARAPSWSSASGSTRCARAMRGDLDYAERRTRAAHRRAARTATREATRRARGAPDGDLELRLRADGRRRRAARSTSRGSAAQHDGNLNCPLAGDAVGLLLRRARAHRPRRAALARAPTGRSTVDRARGLPAERAPAGRGRRRQRRDLAPRRRPGARARLRAARSARATMNNLTLGERRLHLLRDARRRPGRLPGRRRAERACTWRCRTRSTRPIEALELEFPLRVRRVRAAARLGRRGRATAAATASCASSRRSTTMRYSLITERRRHAPPGADGRRAGRAWSQPAERGRAAGQGAGALAPGRPAADRDPRRWRTWQRVSAACGVLCGLGIMGGPMAANLARAGLRADRLQPHAGEGRDVRGGARRHASRPPRARPPRAPRVVITMVRRRARGRGGAARRGGRAARRARRALSRSTCRRSPPRPPARSASGSPRTAHAFVDAPVTGSAPEGRGRHAHDHGRRRAEPTSSARGRCSRRWARRSSTSGPQGQASWSRCSRTRWAPCNAAALAESVLAAERAGVDLDALLEVARRQRSATRRCSSSRAGRCSSTTSRRCSSSSTCSRTSGTASPRRAAPGVVLRAGLAGELYARGVGRGLGRAGLRRRARGRRGLTGSALTTRRRVDVLESRH